MKKILALGLAVAALFALPGAVRASNVAPRSMFIPDTVYARQWAPARAPGRGVPGQVIGAPAGGVIPPGVVAPQVGATPVWIDQGWAWDGWQWVWVPGHWTW